MMLNCEHGASHDYSCNTAILKAQRIYSQGIGYRRVCFVLRADTKCAEMNCASFPVLGTTSGAGCFAEQLLLAERLRGKAAR